MIGGYRDRMVRHQPRLPLPPAPQRFNAPTELVAAVMAAGAPMVDLETRERLARAAAALPTEGLPSAWFRLADEARAYVERHAGRKYAPPADQVRRLLSAAIQAGVSEHFRGWGH